MGGGSTSQLCAHCGSELRADARFCRICGQGVLGDETGPVPFPDVPAPAAGDALNLPGGGLSPRDTAQDTVTAAAIPAVRPGAHRGQCWPAGGPPPGGSPAGEPPAPHQSGDYRPADSPPAGYPSPGYPSADHPPASYQTTNYQPADYPSPDHPPAGYPTTNFEPPAYQPAAYPSPDRQPAGYPTTNFEPPAYQPAAYPSPDRQPAAYPPPDHPPAGYPTTDFRPPDHQPEGYRSADYQQSAYRSPDYPPADHQSPGYQAGDYPSPDQSPAGYRSPDYAPPGYPPPDQRPPRGGGSRRVLIGVLALIVAVGGVVAGLKIAAHASGHKASGSSSAPAVHSGSPVTASTGPASPSSPTSAASSTAPAEQEGASNLSTLLAQSVSDRGDINNAYNDVQSCGPTLAQDQATFQQAVTSRQGLLSKLGSMPDAAALPAGMINSLTQAWQASISADQDFAAWAADESANCTPSGSDANLAAATGPDNQATADKTAFVGSWNPIAQQYRLPTYTQGQL